jgi:DNA-binding MarR family transcriptional regulator
MSHIVDRHLANISKALRPHGLSAPMWRVLNGLQELEKPTIGDLSAHTAFERSYVSRVVAQMKKAGLLTTESDKLDGRIRAVRITTKGRASHAAAITIVRRLNESAVEGLSRQEREDLYTYIRKVAFNVGASSTA